DALLARGGALRPRHLEPAGRRVLRLARAREWDRRLGAPGAGDGGGRDVRPRHRFLRRRRWRERRAAGVLVRAAGAGRRGCPAAGVAALAPVYLLRLRHQRVSIEASAAPRPMLSSISQISRVFTEKKTKLTSCLL